MSTCIGAIRILSFSSLPKRGFIFPTKQRLLLWFWVSKSVTHRKCRPNLNIFTYNNNRLLKSYQCPLRFSCTTSQFLYQVLWTTQQFYIKISLKFLLKNGWKLDQTLSAVSLLESKAVLNFSYIHAFAYIYIVNAFRKLRAM